MDMQVTQTRAWNRGTKKITSLQSARITNSVRISHFRYALLIFSFILVPNLQAAPSGGQIVGGVGNIHQSGLTTTIQQQTGAMAIDWNTFNVNVDERVQFQQPDVSSIALNRILDQLPSQINGRLDANGRIVLVNPNGLFFGNNASVNVGGLIASGLDIDPMDFMNGDYQFEALENSAGTVFNAGLIQASLGGSVALLGKQVENQGMISADLGIVALAAGKQAVLTFDHSGLLGLRITEAVLQNELGIDPAVLNSGDISAAGGKVLMTASVSQDVFSEAVNTGELQAARSVVVNADGSVTLGSGADLVNTGTVDVSSESSTSPGQIVMLGANITQSGVIRADQQTTAPDTTNPTAGQIELHAQDTLLLTDNSLTSASADTGSGGEIILLGNQIGLFDHARLALNGDTGGGSLLFGGDLRGENPDIPNASAIYIGEATSIQADAIRDGDGGRIIIYATDSAKVFGNISATGGALGGDGGFLETSAGVVNLDFAVDVGAVNGSNGQWLIDPFNLRICDFCQGDFEVNDEFIADVMDSELDIRTLVAALVSSDVMVETGAGGMDEPNGGNITLDTELDYNGNNSSTLTLNAHHDIIINHSITANNGALSLVFNADSNGMNGGDVVINNGVVIDTNDGSFAATGVGFDLANGSSIDTGTGGLNITTTDSIDAQGALIVGATTTLQAIYDITLGGLDITGDLIVKSGNSDIIQSLSSSLQVAGLADFAAGDDIILTNPNNQFGLLQLNGMLAHVDVVGSVNLGLVDIISELAITAHTGSITQSNDPAAAISVGDVAKFTIDDGNDITLTNANNDLQGNVSFAALTGRLNNVAFTNSNANNITLGALDIAGDLTLNSISGEVHQFSSWVVGGLADITAGAYIFLDNLQNDFSSLKLTADDATVTNNSALELAGADLSGTLDLALGNGSITQLTDDPSAALLIDGTATFTVADGESITLNNPFNDIAGNVIFNGELFSLGFANKANITLDALNLSGDLILNSTTGSVGQTAAWDIAGLADLNAADNITLNNAQNDFTELQLSANTANVQDQNGIILGNSNIANDLTLTSNGDINASNGMLTVGGITDINAGNGAILLSNANNDFAGAVSLTNSGNNNATLMDSNALNLGLVNLGTGTLDVTATIGITQSGIMAEAITAGAATFDAGTGALVLNNAGNTFTGAVSLNTSGNNAVTLVNSEAITLATSSLGGNLSVTATAGDITQSDALDVVGIAAFTAIGNDIFLEHADNSFNGVELTGRDARIVDSDGGRLELGNVTLTGDLHATSLTRAVNQQDGSTLDITGNATFMAAGGRSIRLLNSSNNIEGTVSFAVSNGGRLNDIEFANNQDITLGALDISGDLILNSVTGSVGQTATWVVGGLADLSAATDIILDNFQNDFTSLKLTGVNATVTNNSALALAGADLSGTLDLTLGNGSITQLTDPMAALLIDGMATFTVQDGESITLNNPFNDIAGDVIFNGELFSLGLTNTADIIVGELTLNGNLTLNSTGGSVGQNGAWVIGGSADLSALNAITLGALDISGNLTLDSVTGSVEQNGAWVVGGLADLTAATNVTLQQTQNDFASLKLTGVSAIVTNNSTLTLAGANLSGTLDLTLGNGSITQLTDPMAALLIDGTATFTVQDGESITLNNDFNDFAGDVIFNGALASLGLTNTADIIVGELTLDGDLILNSTTGSVGQTAAWVVGGLADLMATDDITLNNAQNDFTELQLSANTANVRDQNGIILGNSFIANNLTLTGNGNINASNGVLTVGGSTDINAGNGSILLSNTNNNFTGAVSLTNSGNNNVTLVNSDALVLGTSTVGSGTLNITADGITQSGAIIQANNAGAATFNAGNNALTLNNAGNTFTGGVSLTNSGNNNVTLVNNGALTLGASDVGSGTLNITADGITQTGAITQTNNAGLASFDAGAGVLSLNNAANAFTGAVSLTNSGDHDVTLVNSSDLELGDITFDDGELLITANSGNITQASDTRIRQLGTNEMTFTADLGAITLANAGNDFRGQLLLTADAATLADFNGIALGTGAIDTDLTITVTNGVEIITDQQLWIGNDLTMTGVGVMDARRGALVVGGDTTITGTSILLSNTGNALTGTVSLHSQGNNAILLFNTLALQLGDITLGNGAMTITAETGDITQSGAIVQPDTGTGSIVITAAGTDPDNQQSILLDNPGNDIKSSVLFEAPAGLQELRFTNTGDITLTTSILPTINNLTLNSTGGNVEQQQNASWTVTGLADISAAGNIILNNNQVQNNLSSLKLTAVNADVINNSALVLAGADLSGTLDLTLSNGSITQLTDPMAALLIDGTATFTVQDGESITLNNPFNDIAGDVIFNGDLTSLGFTNTADITLSALTLDGSLTLNSTGGSVAQTDAWIVAGLADLSAATNIVLTDSNNQFSLLQLNANSANVAVGDSVELGLVDIANNFDITAHTGSITQAAAMTVGGASTFTLTGGSNLALNNSNNNLQGPVSFLALGGGQLNDVAFTNAQAITLGALDITGDLTIEAESGNITQTGRLAIAGTAAFTADNNIILERTDNNFNFVELTGRDARIVDSDTLILGAVNLSRDLEATARNGNVQHQDPGDPNKALNVARDATFTAADGQSIKLLNTANDIAGTVSFAVLDDIGQLNNIEFANSNTITLDALIATSVTLNSTAGGIEQIGALTVANLADFIADEMIELTDSNNQFGLLQLDALSASVDVGGSVELGLVDIANTLNLTTQIGNITQSAALTVGGLASFAAANDIVLTADNNLSQVSLSGTNVTLHNSGALELAGVGIAEDLNLSLGSGDLSQTAAIAVAGDATFELANAQQVSLTDDNNAVLGLVTFTASSGSLGKLDFTNNGNLLLGALNINGDATLNSVTGNIQQDGAFSIAGVLQANAENGEVIFDNENNALTSVELVANSAIITNQNSLSLGSSNITGVAELASITGDIQQTDAVQMGTLIATAAGDVQLTNTANDFGTVTVLDAVNVSLVDSNSIALDGITASGTLNVTARNGGDISQLNGAGLIINGLASFSVDAGRDIVLENQNNQFAGGIGFAANSGLLNNISVINSQALQLQALNIIGDLTAATIAGDIIQAGELIVAGATTLTAAGDVQLTNIANDFGTVTVSNAANVSLVDSNSIALNGITASGTLDVTARNGGDISQLDGAGLIINGLASFSVDSGRDIVLENQNNRFGGGIGFAANSGLLNNIRVANSQALELQALNIAGGLTVTTTAGDITQAGVLTIAGNAEFNAGNGNILLDQANDFVGAARFNTNGDVMVVDSNRLLLGGSSVRGSFSATAGSDIEQEDIIGIADGLSISGLATFIAAGGQSIQLGNLDNQLNQVAFASSTANPLANLTVANATGLILPNLVLSGDLTIATTAGDITQTSALTVAGSASFAVADGASILLNDAGNNILGNVSFTEVLQELAFVNNQDISLGALNIAGGLTLHAIGGDITQTDAWTVAGLADLTASDGEPFSRIVLDNPQNDFVSLKLTADNVTLSNQNRLILDNRDIEDPIVLSLQTRTTRPFPIDITATRFNGGAMGLFDRESSSSLAVVAE